MSVFSIKVKNSQQLQALILALKNTDKEVVSQIKKQTKALMVPEFKSDLRQRAYTYLENRIIVDTAKVGVQNMNVTLTAGTVGTALSGGGSPKDDNMLAGVEFGADRSHLTTYESVSKRGTHFMVKRHTRNQLRRRNRAGYVYFPTVEDEIPRYARLWIQTSIRTMAEAFEKAGAR